MSTPQNYHAGRSASHASRGPAEQGGPYATPVDAQATSVTPSTSGSTSSSLSPVPENSLAPHPASGDHSAQPHVQQPATAYVQPRGSFTFGQQPTQSQLTLIQSRQPMSHSQQGRGGGRTTSGPAPVAMGDCNAKKGDTSGVVTRADEEAEGDLNKGILGMCCCVAILALFGCCCCGGKNN